MMDLVNIALAALTVGLGGFGFLAPRFTASALDLEPRGSTMGLSEMRASVGGLFVALGLGCLLTGAGWLYAALGLAYAGAAAGRALSITIDRPPMPKVAIWLAFEAGPAVWLIAANWP